MHNPTIAVETKGRKNYGPVRDLNPGPLAPKARIIPLDQLANLISIGIYKSFVELKRRQNVYGTSGEAYQVSLFTSSIEGAD